MSKIVNLPSNHLRSVSVTVYMIEKSIDELEVMLTTESKYFTYETINDLDAKDTERMLEVIKQVRKVIDVLVKKYRLNREVTYMSRILNARESKMWEVLSDTTSKRMKGFGYLPEDAAVELDEDIQTLTRLINLL